MEDKRSVIYGKLITSLIELLSKPCEYLIQDRFYLGKYGLKAQNFSFSFSFCANGARV